MGKKRTAARQLPGQKEASKKARVEQELLAAGAPAYGIRWNSDTKYLHNIIHDNEHIHAAIFGRGEDGFALMAATDARLIYLDKKPAYVKTDDITYDVVSGVSFGQVGVLATVTVHTHVRDYMLGRVSSKCARKFVAYIEERCLEYNQFTSRATQG